MIMTMCLYRTGTMAGKGSELGKTFEEIKQIYDGVHKKTVCGYVLIRVMSMMPDMTWSVIMTVFLQNLMK